MRCFELTGPDERMDCASLADEPLNPLPQLCGKCGFPELDHVPQPYLLIRSRTMSPHELALAENGNFFVRPRIRRVLEVLAPRQCRFFPTSHEQTASPTPWFLVVPKNLVETATVKRSIARCKKCGEPESAHPGTQYDKWLWKHESKYDLIKSSTWGSSEHGWDQWIHRDLFMSVRLFHLLKKIKASGLHEATCGKPTLPNDEEIRWIDEKLKLLEAEGISLQAEGTLSERDATWFRDYIKTHARRTAATLDVKAVERQLKFKLPKSYVEFITKVGSVSFNDVDEEEGFTVKILPPGKFDIKTYRAGALDAEDDETNAVDGVMFAGTKHGDCLCFGIDKSKKEFPIFLYKHEYNYFEPFAKNFAACIKRLAGG